MTNGTEIESKSITTNIYFRWYLRYLEHRLKGLPTALLGLIVSPDPENQRSLQVGNAEKVLVFMAAVATLLGSERDLALGDILEKLEHQGLLLNDVEPRSQAVQLVFIAVGLLTFFYDPVLDPNDGELQIRCPDTAGARASRHGTWTSFSQDASHADLPIVTLLRQFGSVKGPIPRTVFNDTEIASALSNTMDPLISSNISYFTLTRVAEITIEWESSVCLHLEFDMRRKVLKLFRFPSLCGLLCDRVVDTTFLSQYSDLSSHT